MRSIDSIEDLEAVVGTRRQAMAMKSIRRLDSHCERILALAPFALLGHIDRAGGRRARPVGGDRGFARVEGPHRLLVPVPDEVAPPTGSGVATCFLLPGIGEPLRVNGRAAGRTGDGALAVEVEEAFVHCGKCVHRAKLWDPPTGGGVAPGRFRHGPLADPDVARFLAAVSFVVISTWDGSGAADASPKGDPAGFVHVVDRRTIAIPDRKGNRRTDTFHNIVERPDLALVGLVAGDHRSLELTGTGTVTDDAALLAPMAIDGAVPRAALVIEVADARLGCADALVVADLWNPDRHHSPGDVPNMMKVAADHVASNRTGGVLAGLTRSVSRAAATLLPDAVVEAGQSFEYEHGLYR